MNVKFESVDDIYKLLDDSKVSIYDKYPYSHPQKTKGRVKNLTLGRIFVQLLMPDDYPLIDEELTGKKINNILSDIAKTYPPDVAAKVTKTVNEECLKISSYYPATFTPDTIYLSDKMAKRKKELLNENLDPEDFVAKMNVLGNEFIEEMKGKDSGLYDIAKAGASRSTPTDLAVFFIAKGPTTTFNGEINKPILNCLNEGFTLPEFYLSADQAR